MLFLVLDAQTRCSVLINKLHSVYNAVGGHLERFILDVRVLGNLSMDDLSKLRDYMPNCRLEAQLGPEDCKYIDVRLKSFQ